jgi:hypothetical protein
MAKRKHRYTTSVEERPTGANDAPPRQHLGFSMDDQIGQQPYSIPERFLWRYITDPTDSLGFANVDSSATVTWDTGSGYIVADHT